MSTGCCAASAFWMNLCRMRISGLLNTSHLHLHFSTRSFISSPLRISPWAELHFNFANFRSDSGLLPPQSVPSSHRFVLRGNGIGALLSVSSLAAYHNETSPQVPWFCLMHKLRLLLKCFM